MIVEYIDCRVSGTRLLGGTTCRYFEKEDLRNNQCPMCKK